MARIDQRTLDVANLYNSGMSVADIGKKLDITPRSVEKRIAIYKRFKESGWKKNSKTDNRKPGRPSTNEQYVKWSIDDLKKGFERYVTENGHLPTTYEIDDCDYLPSSRQLQRRFGGMGQIREMLGYGNVLLNTGENRREILKITSVRGADAEDKLEEILTSKFGKLYVHSEQRFGGSVRRRVDFVVYARDLTFAIDVFATDDIRMLSKNIDVKLPKYKDFPSDTPLYFLLWSDKITQSDVNEKIMNQMKWSKYSNFEVITLETFLKYIENLHPLYLPEGYKPI